MLLLLIKNSIFSAKKIGLFFGITNPLMPSLSASVIAPSFVEIIGMQVVQKAIAHIFIITLTNINKTELNVF